MSYWGIWRIKRSTTDPSRFFVSVDTEELLIDVTPDDNAPEHVRQAWVPTSAVINLCFNKAVLYHINYINTSSVNPTVMPVVMTLSLLWVCVLMISMFYLNRVTLATPSMAIGVEMLCY